MGIARLRFTVKRMMVLVTVLALALGASRLAVRWATFAAQAREHAAWLRDYRANLAA